jgi:hypothetical protein
MKAHMREGQVVSQRQQQLKPLMDNKKTTNEASDITMFPHVEDMKYLLACVFDCYKF